MKTKTYRTVRYRLHPRSQARAAALWRTAGSCRYVWNHFVAKFRAEHAATGKSDHRVFTLSKQFAALQQQVPWLHEHPFAVIRGTLKQLETTCTKFDKGRGGLPRFKGKYETDASFPLPYGSFKMYGAQYLHVARVGTMRIQGQNLYTGSKPVSGTIKHEGGQWYACLVYAVERPAVEAGVRELAVGLDRNIRQITCSDGVRHDMPETSRLEARTKRYQRMMARRQHGSREQGTPPSRRYLKARLLARKTRLKIAQVRANWCHRVSRAVADLYGVVYVEALATRAMTSKKWARRLNRGILESGWGKLEQCLAYKTKVERVDPAYTSQRCHACGHTEPSNRLSQSAFHCRDCGYWGNADENAALNILAFGSGATGRGGGRSRQTWPVKRQKEAWDPSADGAV